jgi:hypothetical protein
MSVSYSIKYIHELQHFIKTYQSSYLKAYEQYPAYFDDIIGNMIQQLSLTKTIRFGIPTDVCVSDNDEYLLKTFFDRVPSVETIINNSKFKIHGMGIMEFPKNINDEVLKTYIQQMGYTAKYVKPYNTAYPYNYCTYLKEYYENSRYKSHMIYRSYKPHTYTSAKTYHDICEIVITKYSIDDMNMLKKEGIKINLDSRHIN